MVGVPLSGMALNAEFCALGAEPYRAVATAPAYRVHALAGGLPRVGAANGAAITSEVWALSADGFGRFAADTPAPLCKGPLILADDRTPKGLLVEAAGPEGAEEITHFGGSRAFMARA